MKEQTLELTVFAYQGFNKRLMKQTVARIEQAKKKGKSHPAINAIEALDAKKEKPKSKK